MSILAIPSLHLSLVTAASRTVSYTAYTAPEAGKNDRLTSNLHPTTPVFNYMLVLKGKRKSLEAFYNFEQHY